LSFTHRTLLLLFYHISLLRPSKFGGIPAGDEESEARKSGDGIRGGRAKREEGQGMMHTKAGRPRRKRATSEMSGQCPIGANLRDLSPPNGS